MILVLRPGASADETAEVLRALEQRGCEGRLVQTGTNPVVHVIRGRTRRARKLRSLAQVLEVVPTSGPRVRREGWRFYPHHFVQWSAFGVALLGVLVFLAGHLPTGLGAEVDYRRPPESVAQPWYLAAPLAFVGLFPHALAWLAWLLLGLAALAFLFLPFLERSQGDERAGRRLRLAAALAAVLALAFGTWKGLGL